MYYFYNLQIFLTFFCVFIYILLRTKIIFLKIKLLKKYFPIIFYNDNVSFEATNLLNSIENVREKEKKIEWGLYLKLINEPTSILNYENIILFEDILDLDFLIKDSRTDWNDTKLFSFILPFSK